MPSLPIQARNGYSLPKNQTPSVWPLKSSGFLMPVSSRQVSSRPERLNGWAMLTSGTPFSRAASAAGIQSTIDVGAAAGDHLLRRDVRAARLDRHVEAFRLVEALVLGDVIAGELRLRDPFELQRDLVGGHAPRPRPAIAATPATANIIDFILLSLQLNPDSRRRLKDYRMR